MDLSSNNIGTECAKYLSNWKLDNLVSNDVKNNGYEVKLVAKESKYLEFKAIESGAVSIAYKYAASLK